MAKDTRVRNRITFEALGLEPRLSRFAVEHGQPLASVVRQILEFGLRILESEEDRGTSWQNSTAILGAIAWLEVAEREATVRVLLEFGRRDAGGNRQHLVVEISGTDGAFVANRCDVGDALLVRGQLADTGCTPPVLKADSVVPVAPVDVGRHSRRRRSSFSLFT